MDALAHTIPEASALSRISRAAIYQLIARGDLRAVKRGRRTLVLHEDLVRLLNALPAIQPRRSRDKTDPAPRLP